MRSAAQRSIKVLLGNVYLRPFCLQPRDYTECSKAVLTVTKAKYDGGKERPASTQDAYFPHVFLTNRRHCSGKLIHPWGADSAAPAKLWNRMFASACVDRPTKNEPA